MLLKKNGRGEWATIAGKCVNCTKCQIYIEGPQKGRCIYGGPFIGYQRYDAATKSYGPVFTDPPPPLPSK